MSAVAVFFICISLLIGFGYFQWSPRVARLFQLSPNETTPAHNPHLADNNDYVPTPKAILWGHHYTSIAGAAPIIGPAVAVFWGWLPALCWIVFGTIFIGAVHDMGALIISMRHDGKTLADISGVIIHPRVRILFQLVVYCLIWVVLAVFGIAIGVLFQHHPQSVIPIHIQIIAAMTIGLLIHRYQRSIFWPSVIAILILYAAIPLGVQFPITLPELHLPLLGIDTLPSFSLWAILLILYSGIASALPVWLLLQPRDYLNAFQLVIGLGLLVAGLIVLNPTIQAPLLGHIHTTETLNTLNILKSTEANQHPVIPMLFVTVACGAISGFHGLVSSGTTSKQLNKAQDARPIGYGSMVGEAILAVLATLAVTSGLKNWGEHYHSWSDSGILAIDRFVEGAGQFIHALRIPLEWAHLLVAMLAIAFAATSMDTAARIQRYIVTEFGQQLGWKSLNNKWIATAIAVLPPIPLVLAGKQAWGPLWLLFGVTNQLIGGLTFLVLIIYLKQNNRPTRAILAPMLIVLIMTTAALLFSLSQWWQQLGQAGAPANILTIGLGIVILLLEGWFITESIRAWQKYSSDEINPTKEKPDAPIS